MHIRLFGERGNQRRGHASRLKNQLKKLRVALQSGDASTASGLMKDTLALVDRTAKHGVIHKNAASRTKSRLARALARAKATA